MLGYRSQLKRLLKLPNPLQKN